MVCSSFFRRMRAALRLRGPLVNEPTAKVLHSLLMGLVGWVILEFVLVLPRSPNKPVVGTVIACAGILVALPLALLRRGSLAAASMAYLLGNGLLFTIVILQNGGIRSVAVIYYLVLPISAAWLFGYPAALVTAGVCLSILLIMAILELIGRPIPPYLPGTPMGVWVAVVAAMIMAAVPIARILQIYKNTLAQLREYQGNLEALVEERTAELYAANQAKSSFLANISHELRTPLNAILGFSTLVRDDPRLADEHRKDLDIVNRSGEHLLNLIDDVLDLAKIEAGRVVMESAPFDVSGLVVGIVEMMRERASAKNIELLLNASASVPVFARSDAAKLRQVLVNLIGNAVKYTERGRVTVHLDARQMDDRTGILLILEVDDTGIGIAPENQGRIFDAFFQAGTISTRKGTGLGLSITRQFVQMMCRAISVRSALGEGSVFRVELPVVRAEESEALPANDDNAQVAGLFPGQFEYRILIVEDKPENWLLLQRLLLDVGFQVRVAEDGAQGVEMFQIWEPHLIWMDLRLPVKGGLEAAREIRALDGGSQVKIVALTASAFAQQREEVLAAGLDDFVRKPYRSQEIFDCMARHLGVRYLYRKSSRTSPADPVAALTPEALATLSEQMREELANAIVRLDAGPIREVIGRISEQDAQLGSVLANCANRLAYSQILAALEHGNDRSRAEFHAG